MGSQVEGFLTSFLCRTDDLKEGDLIGEDKYGNKYYENNKYFYGESVISAIPSERFRRTIIFLPLVKGCAVP